VAIGTLVAVRRPRNPMGWLMLGAGFCFATNAVGTGYAIVDYHLHHGGLPLGRVAIAFQPGWAMGMVFIAGLLWLFPEGHLPSGRWRRDGGLLFASGILWALVLYASWVAVAVGSGLRVDADGSPSVIDHPAAAQPLWLLWIIIQNVGFIALILSWVIWLTAQIPKYRRSRGDRRLQLKWLYAGAGVFVLTFAVGLLQVTGPVVSGLLAFGIAALPIALGIGIFKFRLYEIDRIISRTVSYALVTGLVVGIYAGVVLLTIDVLRFSSSVGVAASTLIAAVLFNPLRRRAQRLVDKRFNRARYDAEATVAAFADRMRAATDLPGVRSELVGTVNRAFEPTHASVWVRIS
jgi:MFS family permease